VPQIILVAGYFGILVVGVAGWKIACWFFRTILDIPEYPPIPAAEVQQLPYYLDDRITPPKLQINRSLYSRLPAVTPGL
jgi:hypothetical protein